MRKERVEVKELKAKIITEKFRQWSKLWGTQVKSLLGSIYSNLR